MNKNSNKGILVIIALLLAGILVVLLFSKREPTNTSTDVGLKSDPAVIENNSTQHTNSNPSTPVGDTANEKDTPSSYQNTSYVNESMGIAISVPINTVTFQPSSSFANQASPGLKSIATVKNNDGSVKMVVAVPKNNAYFEQQLSNRTYVGVVTYNGFTFKKYSQPAPDSGVATYSYVYQNNGVYYEIYTQNEANLKLLSFI